MVGDRPRRQHFLQLAGGHQAAGAGQEAEHALRRRSPPCGTASARRRRATGSTWRCRPGRRRGRRTRATAPSAAAPRSAARATAARPPIVPSTIATRNPRRSSTISWWSSVPPTASTIAATPANTPWRAVFGSFIHFSEKMNSDRREQVDDLDRRSPSLARLPLLEHLQHAVGDQEAADDVGHRGEDRDRAEHRAQRRSSARRPAGRRRRWRSRRSRWSATSAACAAAARRGG